MSAGDVEEVIEIPGDFCHREVSNIESKPLELRDVLDQGGFDTRIPVRLNIESPNGLLWKEVEYKVSVRETIVNIMKQDVPN